VSEPDGSFHFHLVALPWSILTRPSAALGALTAYVRQHRPDMRVTPHSAYIDVAVSLGADAYDAIAARWEIGELLYAAELYPERCEPIRKTFVDYALSEHADFALPPDGTDEASRCFDRFRTVIHDVVERLAQEIADSGASLVGMTTCFGQLFGNIALARALRRLVPDIRIVLGGSTISDRVGPSILEVFSNEIDFIIQGEGEQPLVALIDALRQGDGTVPEAAGILVRPGVGRPMAAATLSEVADMDSLPVPDFDEYVRRATEGDIEWLLPIEGSRGCWWDRTKRSNNPKATCYFCNLNVQWNGYRQKSEKRIVAELSELSQRYKNLDIFFLDNIMRANGAIELAEGIKRLSSQFRIFYEFRANLKPIEFVALWEAGLRDVQFGIEALSTSLLRRIGKGTTAIQNLQAMRLCAEFSVANGANLIFDFPGATQEDVDETARVIPYALAYEAPSVTRFHLGVSSTVDSLREEFGICNVRNNDTLRPGFPPDVFERLKLFDLSFDSDHPPVDWSGIGTALEKWRKLAQPKRDRPLLYYQDGGSFLAVYDFRFGDLRQGNLTGLEREILLYATQIRSVDQIARRCSVRTGDARIEVALEALLEAQIMFREGQHYLSLPLAMSPEIAAQRIRAAAREDEDLRKARERRRVALPVTP